MKITKEKFTDITETSFDGNTYEACDFSNLRVDYLVLSKVEFIDCNFSNANFTESVNLLILQALKVVFLKRLLIRRISFKLLSVNCVFSKILLPIFK